MIVPKLVILHCSATPDFNMTDKLFDIFGASDIDKWHRERGFDKIGYHIVIRRSGAIEYGRLLSPPLVEKGAHCKPVNSGSIGVCYVGTNTPTFQQVNSLKAVYKMILGIYGISKENWMGHRDFANKSCPGFDMSIIRNLICK